MAVEIERKFLVRNEEWRSFATTNMQLVQAYLARGNGTSVRVRIIDDTSSSLTIKSEGAHKSRYEFEYQIPVNDARILLQLRVGQLVSKRRFLVPHCGLVWEVDVFDGDNAGLVIAEAELTHEDQQVDLPSWIGREVTRESRYSNSQLAICPYRHFRVAGEIHANAGQAVPQS